MLHVMHMRIYMCVRMFVCVCFKCLYVLTSIIKSLYSILLVLCIKAITLYV